MAQLAVVPNHPDYTALTHDLMIELGRIDLQIDRFAEACQASERQPLLERLQEERRRVQAHLSALLN